MSHRWDIFFLFPRPHRRFLWYMSRKFPVVEGGRGVGGVGMSNLKSMETVTILTTNIIHDYHLSEAFISESVEWLVIDAAINHSHEPFWTVWTVLYVSLEITCKCRNSWKQTPQDFRAVFQARFPLDGLHKDSYTL